MVWFELRPWRLAHEKRALAALEDEGWVTRIDWTLNAEAQTAHVNIDFTAGGQLRQARLEYPFIYPGAPPRLVPRQSEQRWSTHQWGYGELCLQLRADTWRKVYDGADILRSARHLLDTEGAADTSGQMGVVPSEHRFTYGQALSWSNTRLVLSDELINRVKSRATAPSILDVRTNFVGDTCIFIATGIVGSAQHASWVDQSISPSIGHTQREGGRIAVITEGDPRHIALTAQEMSCAERWAAFSSIPFHVPSLIVGLIDNRAIALFLSLEGHVFNVTSIHMDQQQRTPVQNEILKDMKVAILGCGSMGSKVATSLVRMGVEKFFLVDSDILHVGNLVRNELDWQGVGAHKVDGLIDLLQRINSRVVVDKWINHLGGQTSVDTLMCCLAQLQTCDLIVETTGSGQGFIYAASVSEDKRIPMVWGRVFGGGFGGYIARSRPGIEAAPNLVRDSIYSWFRNPEHPEPPPSAGIDYATAGPDDQAPLIADDADVSVISAHLTHFAADLLRSGQDSEYPHSAYAIGLRREWVFDQPFDTRPIGVADASIVDDPCPESNDSSSEVKA
ncbi:ThiF family adenylyltransferase [Paenalcaligenes sp. Me131]|uniref:ThiF family adenylyltransferase n=1 Tax=Paenalcaligenes sp. Me131 TaxID=3392636 RepID=UPI003D28A516